MIIIPLNILFLIAQSSKSLLGNNLFITNTFIMTEAE